MRLLHLSCLAIVCIGLSGAGVALGQAPDPAALLRGAAAARESIQSGYLEITHTVTPRIERNFETKFGSLLTFEFNGAKRTVTQTMDEFFVNAGADSNKVYALGREEAEKRGLGKTKRTTYRFGWDGEKLSNYFTGGVQANYRKVGQTMPNIYFDPRLLGIDIYHSFSGSIEQRLSLEQPRSTELIGEERVGGQPAWHIKVINRSGAEFHYWVVDREPFRVLRKRYVSPNESAILESQFDRGNDSPLPNVEVLRWYDKAGQLTKEVTMKVTKAELGKPVSEHVGTLRSLEVPPGTEVFDDNQSKLLGYWTGTEIAPTKRESLQKGIQAITDEPQGLKSYRWAWVAAGAMVVVGGLWLIRWKHRRSAVAT